MSGPGASLLPAGLRDLLPPEAEAEADAFVALSRIFAAHGYERVEPPLLEFEESLLSGAGAAVSEATFRMVDPESHRMMGLRPDMTPQIARIAATRLAGEPRPLRLAYAGQCVTLRPAALSGDRQVPQAGIELIGVDAAAADAEVIAIAAEAVAALGVARASFDLTLPTLAPLLAAAAGLAGDDCDRLLRALDRKDAASVRRLGGTLADTLSRLVLAAGPADAALAALHAAALPEEARALTARLEGTVGAIRALAPGIVLTVDPLEFRGWLYHTGVGVTVYAAGRHEELGRGGRYVSGEGEPACGITLFPAALLRAAPATARRPRVYLPPGTPAALATRLRAEGFATVAALGTAAEPAAEREARRLRCTHLVRGDAAVKLEEG